MYMYILALASCPGSCQCFVPIQLFVAMQAMQAMKSWMRAWDRGYSCGGGEYMYCSPLPQEPEAKTSIAALAERISFSECQRV